MVVTHKSKKNRQSQSRRRHQSQSRRPSKTSERDQLHGGLYGSIAGMGPMGYGGMGMRGVGYGGLGRRRLGMGAVVGARGMGFGGPSIAGIVMQKHDDKLKKNQQQTDNAVRERQMAEDREQRQTDNALKEREMALKEAQFTASQKSKRI